MNTVGIIGRIPFFRDKILFPAIRQDGGQDCITAREALHMEQEIVAANRRALVNGTLARKQEPNILFDFLSLVRSVVSSLTSKS